MYCPTACNRTWTMPVLAEAISLPSQVKYNHASLLSGDPCWSIGRPHSACSGCMWSIFPQLVLVQTQLGLWKDSANIPHFEGEHTLIGMAIATDSLLKIITFFTIWYQVNTKFWHFTQPHIKASKWDMLHWTGNVNTPFLITQGHMLHPEGIAAVYMPIGNNQVVMLSSRVHISEAAQLSILPRAKHTTI